MCNHKWTKIHDELIPSKVLQLTSKGLILNTASQGDLESVKIIILVCTVCGKIDKTITRI